MAMVLSVQTDLDTAGAARLSREMAQVLERRDLDGELVFDLSNARQIDGAGVGALVHAYKRAVASGRSFSVVNAHGSVLETLTHLGLAELLSVRAGAPRAQTPPPAPIKAKRILPSLGRRRTRTTERAA